MESWHFFDQKTNNMLRMASFASTSASFACPMTPRSPIIKFLPEQNCPLLQSCFAELVFAIWEPCINVERPQSDGYYYYDQPWRDLIRDDPHWLWRQLHHCSALQDPQQHFPAWEYLLRYHHGYWKRLVARGITHAVRQRKNATWLADSHRRVFHLLGQHSMAPWLLRNCTTYSPSLTRISLGACTARSDVLTRMAKERTSSKCTG